MVVKRLSPDGQQYPARSFEFETPDLILDSGTININ